MDTSKLLINDLSVIMSIGIGESEKINKQHVLINVQASLKSTPDSAADEIGDVLSYDDLVKAIEGLSQARHYNLVETLAEDIASSILSHNDVSECMVRVEKPDIYEQVRSVGIEITRFSE